MHYIANASVIIIDIDFIINDILIIEKFRLRNEQSLMQQMPSMIIRRYPQ